MRLSEALTTVTAQAALFLGLVWAWTTAHRPKMRHRQSISSRRTRTAALWGRPSSVAARDCSGHFSGSGLEGRGPRVVGGSSGSLSTRRRSHHGAVSPRVPALPAFA